MASNNCLITTFTITERENLTGEHRVKVSIGIRSYPVPLPDQSFEDYFWGLNPNSSLPFTLAGYQQFYLKPAAAHRRSTSVYRKRQVWVRLPLSGMRGREREEAVKQKGGAFAEAPVWGNKKPDEDGQLAILAAGHKALYDDMVPAFDVLGKKCWKAELIQAKAGLRAECLKLHAMGMHIFL